MASVDDYFSVLALFILFRETIEASIICGVLLQFLNRSKPALKKAVWWGVAGGVGVSIIFGVIFITVYYTAKDNLFSGKNRDWFKGIISWIAGLLITILGFAMLRFLGWENKWKRKLAAAMAEKVPDVAPVPADVDAPGAVDRQPAADATAAAVPPPTDAAPEAGPGAVPATRSSSAHSAEPLQALSVPEPERQPSAPPTQQPSSPLSSPTLATTSSSSASKKSAEEVDAAVAKKRAATSVVVADVEAGGAPAVAITTGKLSYYDNEATDADAAKAVAAAPEDLEPCDRTPATRKENTNIFVLVFTTVVREGIESVVFLGGLANVKLSAIPLPAFVGIVCGVLVGVFLYYSGKQVKHIKWLVIIMAIIIFFIAAGQVSLGTDALMRAGAFGFCSPWLDERPWYMVPIYDWSACCSDIDPKGTEPTDQQNRQRFFALARAIFGYQDKGTPVEIIAYCCYWGLVLILMAYKAWRGTLLDADYKYTRQQRKLAKEAAARERAEAEAAARGAAALEAGGEVEVADEAAVAGEKTAVEGLSQRFSRGWKRCVAAVKGQR